MLSRPIPADIRARLFKHKRRRVAAPRGEPFAAAGGDDAASVPRSLRGILRMPENKFILRLRVTHTADGSGNMFQHAVVTDPSSASGGILGLFSNWNELIVLYDSYKVDTAVMNWYPHRFNEVLATTSFFPMSVAFDPDSDATPASVDAVIQYGTARTFNMNEPFRYAIKLPKAVGASAAGWRDCGAPTLQPMSFLIAADNLTASQVYGMSVWTLVVRMKNSR